MDKKSNNVYRFAPSPSGFLHIGGARTAIFNWLLAKNESGKFLLRIEDTDQKRSSKESTDQILSSLRWLGLDWDDNPVFQSSRRELYRETAESLLNAGKAYRCFCTAEELKSERQKVEAAKAAFMYDGRCKCLADAEIATRLAAGESFAIRLIVEDGETTFDDSVRGRVTVQHSELDDFIILRSDKSAIYHLAVVVDDHFMQVSHVVRGEDHLSNTPKQILIYQALGWRLPTFAHLPLIHGPDGGRLSKRHGATSVEEFRDNGILADALFNYLCLLGWATGDDREIFAREEIISLFSLSRVNKKNAVFDTQKLQWINGKYLSMQTAARVIDLINPRLNKDEKRRVKQDSAAFSTLINLVKTRAKTLTDIYTATHFYFHDPTTYDEKGIEKYFRNEKSRLLLLALRNRLETEKNYESSHIEMVIRGLAEQMNSKAGDLIHPLRLALTGETASPGIFDIIAILGKERILCRIDRALAYLEK